MADMKEIKVTATSERYAAKFHKALELMQKGGIGGQGGGFTEKTFKAMNRELDKMVKAFGKIGVDVRDVAKGMSETWAKSIKNNTKSLEQYGKLLKKTSEDSRRSSAVLGRLSSPQYQKSYEDRYAAENSTPWSSDSQLRAEAREKLAKREAIVRARHNSSNEAYKETTDSAFEAQVAASAEQAAALRNKLMGAGALIGAVGHIGSLAARYQTERYRQTTQGTRTASQFYDRFAQGDLAMAATMKAGGQEAMDAGSRAETESYLSSGGKLAAGLTGAGIGFAMGGPVGMVIGVGGALGAASGAFDLATGKAGAEKQKAVAEYLDLMNQNDPRRKRILTDAAQNATGYANYLGQFGGGISSSDMGQGRNFGSRFGGMKDQAKMFGMDWRESMGMHANLSGAYGTENAYGMMRHVAGAEQVYGMSKESVSGTIGSMSLQGNTRASQAFMEIMAKATAKGMDDSKMRQDFAAVVASFESTAGLGRTPGTGVFTGEAILGSGINMKDMGAMNIAQQVQQMLSGVAGNRGGEVGVVNRTFSEQAVRRFIGEKNKARADAGLPPLNLSPMSQYRLFDEAQNATFGAIAKGSLTSSEEILTQGMALESGPGTPGSKVPADKFRELTTFNKKEFYQGLFNKKVEYLENLGVGKNIRNIDFGSPQGKIEGENIFYRMMQRAQQDPTSEQARMGAQALASTLRLTQKGVTQDDQGGLTDIDSKSIATMEETERRLRGGGGTDFSNISAEVAGAMDQMFKDMSDPNVKGTLDGLQGVLGTLLNASASAGDIQALVDALNGLPGGTKGKDVVGPKGGVGPTGAGAGTGG
jgi:hypothetical protein